MQICRLKSCKNRIFKANLRLEYSKVCKLQQRPRFFKLKVFCKLKRTLVPFVKFYWFMSKIVSNFTGRPGRPNDNGLVMCSRTLLSRIWHQKILYQSFCSFQIWNFWKVLVTLNRFEFLKIEVILHKINGFERAKSLSTTMAKIT